MTLRSMEQFEPSVPRQGAGRRKMDRVNAERAGGVHIRGDVVDIDGSFRIDREALEQQFENAGVGFDDPDLTRNQNAAKPA